MVTAHHHIAVTLAFLIIFLLVPALPAHAKIRGFRATMIRRTRTGTTTTTAINFTQAAGDSRRRLELLASRSSSSAKNSTVPVRWDDGGGAYLMELSIGTPPQKLTAFVDTGRDLIWAKCGATCAASSSSCTPPGTPSYHPSASSTFAKLPCSDGRCGFLRSDSNSVTYCGGAGAGGAECDYSYTYSDGRHTEGFLASETFALGGDTAARGVGFGCSTTSEDFSGDGSGIVGLSRGPLSLVSQLGAGAFMYCLTRDASKSSPLLLGSLATLTGAHVQSTPLLPSTTQYKVNLRSVSIGSATVAGPDDGGVVFDSGTTLTYLTEPAYSDALEAFVSQLSSRRFVQVDMSPYRLDTCYRKPSRDGRPLDGGVPTMVLHFDGGADMALPVQNYFVEVGEGTVCWVVQRSPHAKSVIGNIMQQNYLVHHDVRRSVLSFQPANCDTYQNKASSGSRSPFLYQFCTVLLCFYVYMYTSVF